MAVEKAQLDTLDFYLQSIAPQEKAEELLKKFQETDEKVAQKAIVSFEQRSSLKVSDVERILEKERE